MPHEIYDQETEANDRKIYLEGIQKKFKEIIEGIGELENRENQDPENKSWVFSKYPRIREKLIGVKDLANIINNELTENNTFQNIIINESDLDHELGNFTYNLASIKRIDSNRYTGGVDDLLRVLEIKTSYLSGYLSQVAADPEYLKHTLANPHYFEKAA